LETNTRVGIESTLIHLEQTLLILIPLVMGRDLGLLVELGLKTDYCNPLETFVKSLIIIVEQSTALSPIVGQY